MADGAVGESDPPSAICAPVFSLPLATAAGNCPKCERPWHFEMRPNKPDLNGKFKRCVCGTLLGRYRSRVAGWRWLEVACPQGVTGHLTV